MEISNPEPSIESVFVSECDTCGIAVHSFPGLTEEEFVKQLTKFGYKKIENNHCIFSFVCPLCVPGITEDCSL